MEQYDIFDGMIECLKQKQFKQYSVSAKKVPTENAENYTGGINVWDDR